MMGGKSSNRQLYMSAAVDGLNYQQCVQLAEMAERALLHALIAPESSRLEKPAPSSPVLEPFTLLAALSASTSTIGLIAEVHSAFYEPFHAARKLAALDYMSSGRAGCLTLPGQEAAAANFGRVSKEQLRPHGYEASAAVEFAEAMQQLWDSWDDDALIYDKQAGMQFDEAKVREVNYTGRYYSTRGPLNIARPPQGHPPIVVPIRTQDDKLAAARVADVMIIEPNSLEEAIELSLELRELLRQQGRQPEQGRILASLTPIAVTAGSISEVDLRLGTVGGGGKTARGRLCCAGTAEEIADWIQLWHHSGAVDGFHIQPPLQAALDSFGYFAEQVIPELQRRGMFRQTGSSSTSLREQLGLSRPINQFHVIR
ncbi:Flavin-dependent oxidoreductase, luciferase family (includes alkanesulfonate monooxygenase SsuD and methylene tetrahydromethanopterin reductase) [Paenibacillus algorifonticola]|uniref:Flavin-dependent oxidoreductase, luciferase family (Includes alkanesulfonate monooxygenase SsuD and methylene tetrahydromethanopterin reductase) n=1 Tax=Paenibacillus algorifonticola TaxID=684063 RepID=A0A1I2GHN6_9BACL|nr:LLM class flavin-dependent oxidoreductase [Paenibacillus algorifonticola]SFF17095.1 Flavin-dependent oxidoreductase, luciferase family (includes alkanesulfonate monooxygenase SsuD and methylene tetrahydromethanopterin reductase) [Paenibacillus algorifonticola]